MIFIFFFNDTATTEIYTYLQTLSLHDALPSSALPMLHQGITTLAINPDGGGPAELGQQITDLNTNIPGVNVIPLIGHNAVRRAVMGDVARSKEHTAELQSLMRISYAVFCLQKTKE